MARKPRSNPLSRRRFLAATGGMLAQIASGPAAAPTGARRGFEAINAEAPTLVTPSAQRKIPIGVFDPVFGHLSLDALLDKLQELGLEAVEIASAGPHCPLQDILDDSAKARAWKKKFDDKNIRIGALSCHGNPVHPDAKIAGRDREAFRRTVTAAERVEVPVVVTFSGCPAGSQTDRVPNWATYTWPPDFAQALRYQWDEVLIPYWKEAAALARQHGGRKVELEMHPNFSVYNPKTLVRLREAAGEEVGANCDLSHLFWQGCDPVEVIRFLGNQGALYHAHMKDTVLFKDNLAKYGVLNFVFEAKDLAEGSATFRAVGYGHSAEVWKEIVRAYMDVGFEGILSIENEDPILSGEVGVERAAYVLKNVRAELLAL